MSLAHSPKIVSDGLLAYLDAANPKSYPGIHNTNNVSSELVTDSNLLVKDDALVSTVLRTSTENISVSLCSVTVGKKYIVEVHISANRGTTGGGLRIAGSGGNVSPTLTVFAKYVGIVYRSFTALATGTLTISGDNTGTDFDVDYASVKEWYDTSDVIHGQWYDLSGNKNHGTLVNGVAIEDGTCVLLDYDELSNDATNDYVSLPSALNKITVPWTMSCWFNMSSVGYDTATKTLGLMGGAGTSATGSGKLLGITSTKRLWGILYNGTGNQTQQFGTTVMNLDTWYNGCYTFDGTTVKLYLNAVKEAEASVTGYTPDAGASTQVFTVGLNRIYYHFGGKISAVKVYNKALSESEVLQNFNALKGRYGL